MKKFFSLLLVILMTLTTLPAFADSLQKGSSGDDVLALQQRLNELGYDAGTADGVFGNKTVDAVSKFELMNGRLPIGLADSQVQDLLFSEEAKAANSTKPAALVSPFTEYINQRLIQHIPTVWGGAELGITRNDGSERFLVVFDPQDNSINIWYEVGTSVSVWFCDILPDKRDMTTDNLYVALRLMYELCDSVDYVAYVNEETYKCYTYRYNNHETVYSSKVKKTTNYPEGSISAFMTSVVWDVAISQTREVGFSFISSIDWDADPDTAETATPAPAATLKPTATPTPKPTAKPTTYSKADCKNIAINTLKNRLKNPASLQVHSVSIDGKDGDSSFGFEIDFSAQNSLGGYKRQTFFCIVDANTGYASMVTII